MKEWNANRITFRRIGHWFESNPAHHGRVAQSVEQFIKNLMLFVHSFLFSEVNAVRITFGLKQKNDLNNLVTSLFPAVNAARFTLIANLIDSATCRLKANLATLSQLFLQPRMPEGLHLTVNQETLVRFQPCRKVGSSMVELY